MPDSLHSRLFRLPALLRGLLSPPPMPTRTRRVAQLVVGGSALLTCVFMFLGPALGRPLDWAFGERKPGTFLSVGLLVGAGVVAFRVARLMQGITRRVFWVVLGGLLVFAGADDLFKIHE